MKKHHMIVIGLGVGVALYLGWKYYQSNGLPGPDGGFDFGVLNPTTW